jgi:hypothetical protein
MSRRTCVDPQLAATLQANPEGEFQLLVRVRSANDETERRLLDMGFQVRQRLRLIPTFAVTGPGRAALKLPEFTWVERVEEDQPVHTM